MARPTAARLLSVAALEDRAVPATVSGVVFNDTDGNGSQGQAESGVAGVAVRLDGVTSTTTDATGTYTFADVAAGSHTVAAVPGVGATLSGPQTVTVAADPVTAGAIAVKPTGVIKGVVFADLNGNGTRDAGEPGLADIPVQAGTFTATTDKTGAFSVGTVPDGALTVTATAPANFTATNSAGVPVLVSAADPAAPLAVGLKPTTGLSGTVTLAAAPGVGLSGLTVRLDPAADGTGGTATTTTDATGHYLFSNVVPGQHAVAVDAPVGTSFVTPDGSGKLTPTVGLPLGVPGGTAAGGVQTGLDLAVKYAGSLTVTLYVDANGNNQRDPGEATQLPAKVEVQLAGTAAPVAVTVPTKLTDGTFTISGLPDGVHTLIITPAPGSTVVGPNRTQFQVFQGSAGILDPIKVVPPVGTGTGTGTPTGTGTGTGTVPPAPLGATVAVGSGSGSGAMVYTFATAADGTLTPTAGTPLTRGGDAGTRVAVADFNGDGVADTITATGPGQAGLVRVTDGKTGGLLVEFAAFETSFTGGVNLAAGDFNKDGKADIVVSADTGGGPRVRVFDAAQLQAGADPAKTKLLADFFGIADSRFRGGARVAVGDLNRDGTPDLVVAAGTGGGPRVAIYDGKTVARGQTPTRLVADFFVFEPKLRNGAVVAVGDVNGDGYADLVAGAGPGGAPRVTVFSGQGIMTNQGSASTRIADFYVTGDTTSRAGTAVTVKDVDQDGKADVIATAGGKAYVFTSTSISKQFVQPQPAGPASAATLDGFGTDGGLSLG